MEHIRGGLTRTPFADWHDDLAWMERRSGPKWNAALRNEAQLFAAVSSIPSIRRDAKQFAATLNAVREEVDDIKINGPAVRLSSYVPQKICDADFDFDTVPAGTVALFPRRPGSEYLSASWFSNGSGRGGKAWTIDHVGDRIAIICDTVYYMKTDPASNRAFSVECADLLTGRHIKTLFDISDDPRGLILMEKAEGRSLFFKVEHSGTTHLYFIDAEKAEARLLDDKSELQVPLGLTEAGEPAWVAIRKDGKQFLCSGGSGAAPAPKPLDLPPIIAGSLINRWLITSLFGTETLYICLKGATSYERAFVADAGEFYTDGQARWSASAAAPGPQAFTVRYLARPPQRIILDNGLIHEVVPQRPADYRIQRGAATSAAHPNVRVPFLIASATNAAPPKALLLYAYGFYGHRVDMSKLRANYAPLLEKGWAVAFAFIRGGGEGGADWASAGRLYGRERTFADFEAVLAAVQKRTGVPPERTVLTGRSAGGALLGAMVARHPTGDLFKGVYTEVPFVDGLRTQLNMKYPMTTVEQDEYGDPARSLVDFMTVFEFSATNRVPDCGVPQVLVIARTGENDSQVLPYEPLKWIWRLRGPRGMQPWKLFGYAAGQGHFYNHEAAVKARSADLAILHNWIMDPAVREKMSSISIKMATRKNNARKNRNTRKNNNSSMAGGKRRKAAGTRKNRKSRKANRKH